MRLILVLTVGSIALGACADDTKPLSHGASGRVVAVVDGDTLDIRFSTRVERVRLIGIDTPETKKPGHPIECFGPEATQELTALTPPGTEVVVRRDIEPRDDYGRLLLYVFRFTDGLFVNAELVNEGFARPLDIPPNTTFTREFRRLAASAQAVDAGLWKACSVTP